MVKRIFKLFGKEINGLHEAAYLLGFFALLSQILALVRDRMLAAHFGASHSLDLYYAAFNIPDLIFVTFASVVSISVLVPFIINKIDEGFDEGKKFINNIFSFFFLLIVAVCLIAFFLVPIIMPRIFPGLAENGSFDQLISISRILLLSPILLGLSNFFASITQVYKRFIIYAVSPLLYNFGIIVGIIFLYPIFGLRGLVFGVVMGALLHLAIQIPFVCKQKLFPKFSFNIDFQNIKKVIYLSIPRTLTLGMSQISEIALLGLASLIQFGSISVFTFSYNMQSVPLAIIGVSYSVAAFPTLSRLFNNGNKDKFIAEIITSARHIIFWSIPVSVLFIVLRAQIVRTILGSGEFSWSDTRLTAATLAIFTLSVLSQCLVLLFVRGYYSMGNTRKPMLVSAITGVLTIVLSFILMKVFQNVDGFRYFIESLFRVEDIPGTAILMLPLGYSLALIINSIIFWIDFNKCFAGFSKVLLVTLFQSFSTSIIVGFVSYLGLNIFSTFLSVRTVFGIFMQGFLAGMLGIAVGIIILLLLNNQEIKEIWRTLHHKIWRVKPIPADMPKL